MGWPREGRFLPWLPPKQRSPALRGGRAPSGRLGQMRGGPIGMPQMGMMMHGTPGPKKPGGSVYGGGGTPSKASYRASTAASQITGPRGHGPAIATRKS